MAPANANQSGSAKQSTAGKPDSPAKTTSSEAPEPALPAADARPSSMGRRAYQDTPDTVAKPPAPNQQPSIGAIIEQAELNLRIGNVAAARAVLEPFVKTKHPEALAELGKTYDPIELEKFLVPAGTSNRAKAIELYTEATRLGSLVGKIRLDRLTSAPVPVEKQR